MLRLFARSRGCLRAFCLLTAVAAAATQVPTELVDLRFRAARLGLAPLLASAAGVFMPVVCSRPAGLLEPLSSARLRITRGLWLLLLGTGAWLAGRAAFHGQAGAGAVSLRNMAMTAGLGLLCAQVMAPLTAWLPSALVVALTTVGGTVSWTGEPYGWALLLQPTSCTAATCAAVILGIAGSVAYVLRDCAA